MADDLRRTIHAQQAFEFSDVFALKFAVMTFGKDVRRKVKLAEPEMSTDGGRKARQPIVLAPEEQGGRPLVCGWVDHPKKVSELRSFNLMRSQTEARSKGALDLPREEYERAIQEIAAFLRIHGMETTVVDTPTTAPKREEKQPVPERAASPLGPMMAMLAMGIVIGLCLGYLVFGLHVFSKTG